MSEIPEGFCPGGCGRPTDDAEERMCEECVANRRSEAIDARMTHISLPPTPKQEERMRLWTARQWIAGRTESLDYVSQHSKTVFADFPKPKHPSAQEAA